MSTIIEAVNSARKVDRRSSPSQVVWDGLEGDERNAILEALASRDVGPTKLSSILKSNNVNISKYFLEALGDK